MALDILFCKDLMVNAENAPVKTFTLFPKHVTFPARYGHLVLGNTLSVGIVAQGPAVLEVGAGVLFGQVFFALVYSFSFLSPAFWETARCRLKYCRKGCSVKKKTTNQCSEIC